MHRIVRLRPAIVAAGALLLLHVGSPLAAQSAAQSPDSLPFRRGQWGAQVEGNLDVARVGVLRFSSPRRAWVLDGVLSGSAEHGVSSIFQRASDGTVFEDSSDQRGAGASATIRLGRRAYLPAGRSVHLYRGAGVKTSLSRWRARMRGVARPSDSWGWDAGVFAELGLAYRVSPRFAIGAAGGAEATYGQFASTGYRRHSYSVGASAASFAASVYF
jgi:hypothetical protein